MGGTIEVPLSDYLQPKNHAAPANRVSDRKSEQ